MAGSPKSTDGSSSMKKHQKNNHRRAVSAHREQLTSNGFDRNVQERKKGVIMKQRLTAVLFLVCFVLMLLGRGVCHGADSKAEKVLNETTIVSMSPGKGAGQYFYRLSAGYHLRPRCFAIDPNDGSFYVPELDLRYAIRVHKFDKTGRFVSMLSVGRSVSRLYEIAVDLNGDIYLLCGTSTSGSYILRCDKSGKILNLFGTEGPVTDEDIAKAYHSTPETKPYRKKFFEGMFDLFSVFDGNLEIVTRIGPDKRLFYQFEKGALRKLNKEKTPAHIEKKIKKEREKRDVLYEISRKAKRKAGIVHFVTGFDGEDYYMLVSREKLEIRKVIFKEDKTK